MGQREGLSLLGREGEGGEQGGVGRVSLGGALRPATTAFSPWEAPKTAFTHFLLLKCSFSMSSIASLKATAAKHTKIPRGGGNRQPSVKFVIDLVL